MHEEAVLVEGSRALSRTVVDELVNAVATSLRDLGVTAFSRVAVAMPNRIEWVLVHLAIGRLGATHVAVNSRLTPSEAAFMIGDSEASVAVIDMADNASVAQALHAAGAETVVVLGDDVPGTVPWEKLLEPPRVSSWPTSADVSLVVYTSGTTGRPKGALREAGQVDAARLATYAASVAYDDVPRPDSGRRRVLLNMPLHHLSGPNQVAAAQRDESLLVLQRRFDAEEALRLIDRHAITDWTAVPTMVNRVLALPAEVRDEIDLSTLQRLVVVGAPFPPTLKEACAATFGEDLLFEGYGCTETGMIAGIRPRELRDRPGSCGRPFRNVELRIKGADGLPRLPGEVGDIWARTPRVIRGYVGQGPLKGDLLDENGFFRTGDLGYVDTEGYLFLTGRSSDVIICGGVNIYPVEVENHLRTHDAVKDLAVVGLPEPDLGEIAVAVVELRENVEVTADELLNHRAEALATYKRPRELHFTDSLPRNAMGKVLKAQVKENLGD